MDDQILQQLKNINYYTSRIYGDLDSQFTSSQDTISGLNQISRSLDNLNTSLNTYHSAFTNQPWFQFLLGSLVTFAVTFLYDYKKNRASELKIWYDHLTSQYVFHSPDALSDKAIRTVFACTQTKDGVTTKIPEKPLAEKMIIELRSGLKWWTIPKGQLWYLLYKYEKSISTIPDLKGRESIRSSKEYAESCKRYEKVKLHVFKVTGENQHTA